MSRINKFLNYYTDTGDLINIYLGYEENVQGIDYRRRLLDGAFNESDIIICAKLTTNRYIRPRYLINNYGDKEKPIKLKVIFKTLADYIDYIKINKTNISRYVGENANPNTINIIK